MTPPTARAVASAPTAPSAPAAPHWTTPRSEFSDAGGYAPVLPPAAARTTGGWSSQQDRLSLPQSGGIHNVFSDMDRIPTRHRRGVLDD
jgi:hypothetical protein